MMTLPYLPVTPCCNAVRLLLMKGDHSLLVQPNNGAPPNEGTRTPDDVEVRGAVRESAITRPLFLPSSTPPVLTCWGSHKHDLLIESTETRYCSIRRIPGAMRPRYTAANQAAAESQRRLENSKKDITHERTDIAGFTLLFKDQETERKWRFACSPKRTQMTGRFLFMSGLYQALFFIADVNDNGNSIFFKGCWRLACGLACLTLCFLVSASLVVPSQIMLFYVQLLYGICCIPTRLPNQPPHPYESQAVCPCSFTSWAESTWGYGTSSSSYTDCASSCFLRSAL